MLKKLILTSIAMGFIGAAASAATLSGNFNVTAINVTNLDRQESKATAANFAAALAGGFGGADSVTTMDTFSYSGDFDFRVEGPQRLLPYTVGAWLQTGTGTSTILDDASGQALAAKQLSFPDVDQATAITTFFLFTSVDTFKAADFSVTHDDGVALVDDGVIIADFKGPNSVRTSQLDGFDGGTLGFLYVATNGNPSILEIDMSPTPVPLPAGGLLMITGFAAFAAARRRKKAS